MKTHLLIITAAAALVTSAALAQTPDVSRHTYQRYRAGDADRLIEAAQQATPTRVVNAQPLRGDARSTTTTTATTDLAELAEARQAAYVRQPTAMVSQPTGYINDASRDAVDRNARIVRNYQAAYPDQPVYTAATVYEPPLSRHAGAAQTVIYGNTYGTYDESAYHGALTHRVGYRKVYYPATYYSYRASYYPTYSYYSSCYTSPRSYYYKPRSYHSRAYYSAPRTYVSYSHCTPSYRHHSHYGHHRHSSFGFSYSKFGRRSGFSIGIGICR